MKGINELMFIGWMLFGIYIEVFLMILADLWSGCRKAKQRGELRTSTGYKRTIDKIAKYYNALIALTIIDAMQIVGIWYLMAYYEWNIPIFPYVTLFGALGISLVEIKSIYEKADDKTKKHTTDVAQLAAAIAKSKADPSEIAKAVVNYINDEKEVKNG